MERTVGDEHTPACLECFESTFEKAVLQSRDRPWLVVHRACAEFDLPELERRLEAEPGSEAAIAAFRELLFEHQSLRELLNELDTRLIKLAGLALQDGDDA